MRQHTLFCATFFAAPPRCHVSGSRAPRSRLRRLGKCGSRPHYRVLCQTLACRPHESSKCGTAALSWRGFASHPHFRDWIKLAGIGRYCRCFPMPRFSVCAVRAPRFITVLLPLSLIEKPVLPDINTSPCSWTGTAGRHTRKMSPQPAGRKTHNPYGGYEGDEQIQAAPNSTCPDTRRGSMVHTTKETCNLAPTEGCGWRSHVQGTAFRVQEPVRGPNAFCRPERLTTSITVTRPVPPMTYTLLRLA